MTKYDELLKIEETLKGDKFGEWVFDREHKGTEDDPIHLPFPNYTETVFKFIDSVYNFHEKNPDYNLNEYRMILEQNGYNNIDIKTIDVSGMDEKCLMALLMYLVRGERFSDGFILTALEAGTVQRCFKRLREILASQNN